MHTRTAIWTAKYVSFVPDGPPVPGNDVSPDLYVASPLFMFLILDYQRSVLSDFNVGLSGRIQWLSSTLTFIAFLKACYTITTTDWVGAFLIMTSSLFGFNQFNSAGKRTGSLLFHDLAPLIAPIEVHYREFLWVCPILIIYTQVLFFGLSRHGPGNGGNCGYGANDQKM